MVLRILNFAPLPSPRFYTVRLKKNSTLYLIPFIPLSFKGEGEVEEEGRAAP